MGFDHKKSLGQHFLNSDHVPKKMCDAAKLQKGDLVLEIGPGTGVLTREILKRGCKVVAIEADPRAIVSLQENFDSDIKNGDLVIHHHDARSIDPAHFGLTNQGYKVVSNIPYYISGLLFRSLLDTDTQPTDLVFLVQKEVAQRICKEAKESLLSLSVKVFGEPKYIDTVKRGNFTPPPKVDSAIVLVSGISLNNFNKFSRDDFFKILHLGFRQKRKQLLGNLSKEFEREEVEKHLEQLKLPAKIRGEDLSASNWLDLINKLIVN